VTRALESNVTLVLTHVSAELAQAHDELYPERVEEHIPLSLTLLYPWMSPPEITEDDLEGLRKFFAGRPPLEFSLTRIDEFPGAVVYAVPEPDEELRALMRALWERYPDFPPYGRPGSEPPPHCTLGRLEGPTPTTLEGVKERVEPLLPVHCDVREASLLEEYELDRMRLRETFPLGGA
jgi:2'-5' RNA ligase